MSVVVEEAVQAEYFGGGRRERMASESGPSKTHVYSWTCRVEYTRLQLYSKERVLCYKLFTHACLFTDMCRFCLPLINFSKNVWPIKRFVPCHEDKKYLISFRLVSNTKCNISRLLA